ncbi:MAG: hypothetical protein AAFZ49_10355 [Cyanobacteria bacterium J06659_2]
MKTQTLSKSLESNIIRPGPMSWEWVPQFIQDTLRAAGCIFFTAVNEINRLPHIRFQYAPLVFQGSLYYLQRWSIHEWGVSPSQVLFPESGGCPLTVLSAGGFLTQRVKAAVRQFDQGANCEPAPPSFNHLLQLN